MEARGEQPIKASADYAQAIRIDPNRCYPWHNRAHLLLSREQYDKAIADFNNEAIKLDPTYVLSYLVAPIAGRTTRSKHQKAIADYTQSIKLDPNQAYGFSGRADAYNGKKGIRLGHRRLQRSRSASIPSSRPFTTAAATFHEKPRTTTIAPLPIMTRRSASIQIFSALRNRGDVLEQEGRNDRAIADYDVVIGSVKGRRQLQAARRHLQQQQQDHRRHHGF